MNAVAPNSALEHRVPRWGPIPPGVPSVSVTSSIHPVCVAAEFEEASKPGRNLKCTQRSLARLPRHLVFTQQNAALWKQEALGHVASWPDGAHEVSLVLPGSGETKVPPRQDPGPCASFPHSPSGSCHVPRSERNPVSGVGPSLHSLLLPSCPCATSPSTAQNQFHPLP